MEESRELLSETAAAKDLFQYFLTERWRRSATDTTLAAFAQLAALRLSTSRAFISLVDATNQYILIETTQTSSLVAESPYQHGDAGLLFGRATLPRSQGLCGRALDIMSPGKVDVYQRESWQSPLVIQDLRSDDRFKHCPFATSHPSVRFYAAVPINTISGVSIGTLSVMGETPRQGLADVEAELLSDLAHAIGAHLEMTKSNEGHRRSEKMIKGLGMFIQGRTELGDWWLDLGNNNPRQRQEPEEMSLGKTSKTDNVSSIPAPVPASHVSSGVVTIPNDSDHSASPDDHPNSAYHVHIGPQGESGSSADSLSAPPAYGASTSGSHDTTRHQYTSESTDDANAVPHASSTGQSARTITPDSQESLTSKRLKTMFSRACHIIQDCIEVDGAVFLDASITTLSEHSAEPPASSAEDQDLVEKACGVLGFCAGENSSMHGVMASKLKPLTEVFLQSLFHKYPQGHVFSRDKHYHLGSDTTKSGGLWSSRDEAGGTSDSAPGTYSPSEEVSESAEEKALLQMLPGTRSIAFIPLWDSHRERWFAGSFMWTVERTTRVLTYSEDLHYLAAFGNCIMAEVARLDVVGADRAKSDFISSISHELRSPLHGILASVELLQDTTVDSFQHAMIDTIERCGRTLLDTIQHVLDFAKINNFSPKREESTKGRPGLPRSLSGIPSLTVDVDLSLLTEDVVESVFAGHEFQGNSSLVEPEEASGYPPKGPRRSNSINADNDVAPNQQTSRKGHIDVVMDIGWRSNWMFNTQSGALRRVLMNLFGNALKYTESGWVKVSLQAEDIDSAPSQPQRSVITISVKDTGRGIAQDYFHSGLFTPFTQENPMNSGTGLGLSIVLQIVRSLGGTIDITSEQGIGTEVVVTLTLNQAPPAGPPSFHREGAIMIENVREMASGRTIGLVGLEDSSSVPGRLANGQKLDPDPSSYLQASIEGMATQWFKMEVAAPSTFKSLTPDILVVNGSADLREHFGTGPTIVLCSHEALHREHSQTIAQGDQRIDHGIVHFVSKPCGPHKLAKAFAYCLSQKLPQESLPEVLFPTLPSPQSLFYKTPEEITHLRVDPGQYTLEDYFHTDKAPMDEPTAPGLRNEMPEKRRPMLLLVEDNVINLQLLSAFVSKSNYEYHTAENGLLALQAVETAQTPYDVIFMDISMPVMDGMAAAREIRKFERSRGQKPCMIIALTGLGSADSQQEAFSSGMDLFLTKPVRLSHLRSILDEWIPDVATEGLHA